MTPEELKKIAINSSKEEFSNIIEKLKISAENGGLSCTFKSISDGAISQLKEAGFDVLLKTNYNSIVSEKKLSKYYEVKF